jgi:multicomponent Na+:H+ antiporter subunit B
VSATRRRALPAAAALALLTGVLAWGVADLPRPDAPPGRVARLSTQIAVHERHVTNTVGGITFDLRGFDTLGEELILFVAAIGTSVLLRAQRGERTVEEAAQRAQERRAAIAEPVRVLGAWLAGPVVVLGGYVVLHGPLTPGGGFQGGVILAAAVLLVFAAGQLLALERFRPEAAVEVTEAVGACAFALVAIAGLVFAGAAMANFLPLGSSGDLLSGGTIFALNVATGVEVAGAVTLILTELLDQSLIRAGA